MWNEDTTMDSRSGFLDNSLNASGSGTESNRSVSRSQNCVPVMIAHLHRHREELQIWGNSVKLVTIVGILRSLEDLSTKVTFIFEDETGTIKGIKWLEGDGTFTCPVTINSYARAYGIIRHQNNETFLLIVNIKPLEHVNELLVHLMEVTKMTLEGEKEVRQVAKSDSSFVNKTMSELSNNDAFDNNSGLTKDQAMVLNVIKNNVSEYGAERNEIKSKVPQNILAKVDEILEFLSSEGHVYTTKTDDFFKVI